MQATGMLFDPFAKVNETHKGILCSSTGTVQEKLKIGTDTYYKPGIKNWTIINKLRTLRNQSENTRNMRTYIYTRTQGAILIWL